MQSYILSPAVVLWGDCHCAGSDCLCCPSTLFGHWKDDRYKEKLEWDAFTHFLSDMAMIQKYAPADLSMWGEWLVYGTALGVGDKVEKAMKALNIRVADTGVPLGAIGMNYAFLPLMQLLTPKPWRFRWTAVLAAVGLVVAEGLVAGEPAGDESA